MIINNGVIYKSECGILNICASGHKALLRHEEKIGLLAMHFFEGGGYELFRCCSF